MDNSIRLQEFTLDELRSINGHLTEGIAELKRLSDVLREEVSCRTETTTGTMHTEKEPVWESWKTFENVPAGTDLPISAPPCPTCRHWRPIADPDPYGKKRGSTCVTLCHAPEMWPDFSCYRKRGEENIVRVYRNGHVLYFGEFLFRVPEDFFDQSCTHSERIRTIERGVGRTHERFEYAQESELFAVIHLVPQIK